MSILMRVAPKSRRNHILVFVQEVEKWLLMFRPPKLRGLRRRRNNRFGRNVAHNVDSSAVFARIAQRRTKPRHLTARIVGFRVVFVAQMIENSVDRQNAKLTAVHILLKAAKLK